VAFPLRQFLADNPDVAARIRAIQSISSEVRTSQYFLTRACNIRCKGCWFFTYGLDEQADDQKDLVEIDRFLESERGRGITAALLVGGEPTLVPKKVERFVRALPFVTVTTNGWRPLSPAVDLHPGSSLPLHEIEMKLNSWPPLLAKLAPHA